MHLKEKGLKMIEKIKLTLYLLFPLRPFIFEKLRLFLRKHVLFHKNVYIYKSYFGGYNRILSNTAISSCHIGRGTYIGSHCQLMKCQIGNFCSIGDKLRVGLGSHPSANFVSTHPAFYSPFKQAGFTFSNEISLEFKEFKYIHDDILVEIGNDVWIGYNVTILDGVKIGDGAIIAAGAVVTKDIQPYSIVGGIPAKHLKNRFNNEEIEFLLSFRWWEKDMNWLKTNYKLFNNIETLRNNLNSDLNLTIK